MTGVKVRFVGIDYGTQVVKAMTKSRERIARGITGGARDAARDMLRLGQKDMQRAGNFGARWMRSLHADVTPKSGFSMNARIDIFHTIPYARIFEFGGVIHGKPLLWIPMSYTGITKSAGQYAATRGGLFRVNRKRDGLPLLLSIKDHQVKYFGKTQVREKRKFHMRDVTKVVMNSFQSYFLANMKR